jgi:DNA (cytosine-5)-methyltransferase 1
MRLLDGCACAGLAGDGYAQAGWEVFAVDVDRKALEHNAHPWLCGDVLTLLADRRFMAQFDAVHLSPPCQLYSATRQLARAQGKGRGRAVDLLTPVLELVRDLEVPWVVENVPRSPLEGLDTLRLCGSMFGLAVQRHRLFYSNVDLGPALECDHSTFEADPVTGKPRPWGVYYAMGDSIPSGGRTSPTLEHAMVAMGVEREVPWRYLCEGLPPAYTELVGRRLAAAL